MLPLVRNLVLFISHICGVPRRRKLNCDWYATGSRRVWDTRDDFATILRLFCEEFCRIKKFNMLNFFANVLRLFATVCDTCEEIANHCDCFETALRLTRECKSQAVAKQSHPSEIGVLRIVCKRTARLVQLCFEALFWGAFIFFFHYITSSQYLYKLVYWPNLILVIGRLQGQW